MLMTNYDKQIINDFYLTVTKTKLPATIGYYPQTIICPICHNSIEINSNVKFKQQVKGRGHHQIIGVRIAYEDTCDYCCNKINRIVSWNFAELEATGFNFKSFEEEREGE